MNRRHFLASTLHLPLLLQERELDLILKRGLVIDGSGEPGRVADVAIRGERVAAVGDLTGARAARTLDVSDLAVSPGFIDVHTHSEEELLTNPKAESKVRQGVTTEFLGLDGGSFAPDAFAEKLAALESSRTAVNAASFVGQGTIRQGVLEMSDRAPSPSELEAMRDLARQALRAGALGISSGLEYTPGGFASREEIAGLCSVMPRGTGRYATHMRNEDDRLLEAVDEAIAIAETAGVGLHISHLKCQGKRNWSKADEVFARIAAAESRGVSVTMDRYPYIAYSTGLSNLMPLWSREGGTMRFIARLNDPLQWLRIREAMAEKIELLGDWSTIMISSVNLPENKRYEGKTIQDLVMETGGDPFDITKALVIAEENRIGVVGFGMSEETTAKILAHPKCMPASDGSALADYGPLAEGNPHPRSYGTFARVLGKYVREMETLSLEEAVRKMTSLPAERFGLAERGRLKEGYFADIVVFDPKTVKDRATFAEPHQYATGVAAVLVNGRVVFEEGERTEELPGRVLRAHMTPRS